MIVVGKEEKLEEQAGVHTNTLLGLAEKYYTEEGSGYLRVNQNGFRLAHRKNNWSQNFIKK
jgi:hypothetical protein